MKEIGILFKSEMVRAILSGQKTLTSRLIKLPDHIKPDDLTLTRMQDGYTDGVRPIFWWDDEPNGFSVRMPWQPGDVLWVRETWGSLEADHPKCPNGRKPRPGDRLVYRANPGDDAQWGSGFPSQGNFCWRSSMFMPRWASRITLEVEKVWPSRLQDMTEEMACMEGVEPHPPSRIDNRSYRRPYEILWDRINAKSGHEWAKNEWVFRILFKKM